VKRILFIEIPMNPRKNSDCFKNIHTQPLHVHFYLPLFDVIISIIYHKRFEKLELKTKLNLSKLVQ